MLFEATTRGEGRLGRHRDLQGEGARYKRNQSAYGRRSVFGRCFAMCNIIESLAMATSVEYEVAIGGYLAEFRATATDTRQLSELEEQSHPAPAITE